MRGFRDYVPLGRALETVERLSRDRSRREEIGVKDAYGRVAADDVSSPSDVPDRTRSHMDGYAALASDLRGASPRTPKALSLKPTRGTGHRRAIRVSSGQTASVVTGGLLPLGADTVVPVEEVKMVGSRVIFTAKSRRGNHCFEAGSDVRKGDILVRRGRTIRAQEIGLLALLGVKTIAVWARPRVALIATGSELVSAFGPDDPSRVRESHTPIFENLIRENGGEPVVFGIVPDDVGRIASALELALRNSDLVLTLGGTSVGERDLVEKALRRVAKGEEMIHGIGMDRGRVAGLAEARGKPVVMLPGPVQGAMNAFVLLALPLISRLAGSRRAREPSVVARLETGWKARKRFQHFTKVMYVSLRRRGKVFVAKPMVRDTESMSILVESNGFVLVPERTVSLRAGADVEVRLLPGFSYLKGGFLEEG
ncbi:MAG: molybdopterin molybdotransferase MoeA [Thaumarchaeota archaeon]|nr:molybdopterin molybdotransferase MoeA [Nitrososphaerota archaeon]